MSRRSLFVVPLAWSLAATAAFAATASQTFTDVPAGHWAERAVTDVAIDRHFMVGYPDHTFRGPQPFTRAQMALAIDPLIDELEGISKVGWAPARAARSSFTDLPADPGMQASISKVAGRYHLFDGIIGTQGTRFGPDARVSRYEMGSLIDRLLHLGEAKGVVDASVLVPRTFLFTDVPSSPWPLTMVHDVADKYQVMVGFPNHTFRGPEKLTRYQFAAAAAQTFPLVKELVRKTEAKHHPSPSPAPTMAPTPAPTATPAPRFMEDTPLQVGVSGRVNNVIGVGGEARLLGYEGDAFWMLDSKLGVPLCTSDIAYNGDLVVGWALTPGWGLYVQPYVGGRFLDVAPAYSGGAAYGALIYQRPTPQWGWWLQGVGSTNLWARQGLPLGATWGSGLAGVEYHFTPAMSIYLEGTYAQWPRTLNAPAGTPYDVDSAVNTTLGLSLGL